MINVTVWNEFGVSCKSPEALKIYPNGHHKVIENFLNEDCSIRAVSTTMDEPCQGLTDELLNNTDVLVWWGHMHHDEVSETLVDKIVNRVNLGMGIILLHSSHKSKVFMRLVGADGALNHGDGQREKLWVSAFNHPITKGIKDYIALDEEEMYGEPFICSNPDEVIFNCWFEGGRVFRGGLTYHRGAGKIFYFQPGHESFPTYYNKDIQKVITNAVKWAYNPDIKDSFNNGYRAKFE